MTNKERLEIIKQRINTIRLNTKIGSRRIADEENAVLLDNIEYNLNKFCELIERYTPMKPAQDNSHVFRQYNCKVCNSRLDIPQLKEVNFCPKCGQRIDWSNE